MSRMARFWSARSVCIAKLILVGLLTAPPISAQSRDGRSGHDSARLIPTSLARVQPPAGDGGFARDVEVASAPNHAAAVALPRRRFLGLNRGAKAGAIAGGVILGIYGAVWCNRECEGSPRAPALYGFVVGGATGALAGAVVGGIVDRIFRLW